MARIEPEPTKSPEPAPSTPPSSKPREEIIRETVDEIFKLRAERDDQKAEARKAKADEKAEADRKLAEANQKLKEKVKQAKKLIPEKVTEIGDKLDPLKAKLRDQEQDIVITVEELNKAKADTESEIKKLDLSKEAEAALVQEIVINEVEELQELAEVIVEAKVESTKLDDSTNLPFHSQDKINSIMKKLDQAIANKEMTFEEAVEVARGLQNFQSPETAEALKQFEPAPKKKEGQSEQKYEKDMDRFVMKRIANIERVGLSEQGLSAISIDYRTLIHVQMDQTMPSRVRDMIGAYFKYFNAKRVYASSSQAKEFSAVAAVMDRDMFANLLKMKEGDGYHQYSEAMFKGMELLEQRAMELLGPRVTMDEINNIHKQIGDELAKMLPPEDQDFGVTLEKMAYNFWRFGQREAENDKFWTVCDKPLYVGKDEKKDITYWKAVRNSTDGKFSWVLTTIAANEQDENKRIIPQFSYVCGGKQADEIMQFRLKNPEQAEIIDKLKEKLPVAQGPKVRDSFGNNTDSLTWLRESMDFSGYMRMKASGLNHRYCPELNELLDNWGPSAMFRQGDMNVDSLRAMNVDDIAAFPKYKKIFDFSDVVALMKEPGGLSQALDIVDPKVKDMWFKALSGLGNGETKYKDLMDVIYKLHEYDGIIPMSRTETRQYQTNEEKVVEVEDTNGEKVKVKIHVYETRKHEIFSRVDEITGRSGRYKTREDIRRGMNEDVKAGRINGDGENELKKKYFAFDLELKIVTGGFGFLLAFLWGMFKGTMETFVAATGSSPAPKRK